VTASFCSSCGARLSPGDRFCHDCGAAVRDEPAAPPRREHLGHYRLQRMIAEGGMGIVYRGFDERLQRTVALKLLRDEVASDEEFRTRFIRESRGAASLDHPNILPVFDAGEEDGTLYIATRLVEGEDLRRLVASEGSLATERALRLTGQIAAALDYAHGHGIVHRDIKPANILVVPGSDGDLEHAYLIDFGISKRADASGPEVTRAGRFVGTPEYAAPEQILGEQVSGQADQYGLACVLFYCLTGHAPYGDIESSAVIQAHLSAPPPQIAAERPDTPPAIDAAIAKAMDKNPASRHRSCRAFVEAARTREAQTVIDTPRPVAEPDADARPRTRRRGGMIAAGLAVLAALIGVGVGLAATGALSAKHDPGHRDTAARAALRHATATATSKPTETPTTEATRKPKHTATPTPPKAPKLDVAALDFRTRSMHGYTAKLPSDWDLVADDERQPSSGGVVRRRTTARDESHDVEVVVDHLTHFDVSPQANRSALQDSYGKVAGYRFVSEDDYSLAGRDTYEWRYDIPSDDGGTTHRVDLMFSDGSSDFAVLATGTPASNALGQLATKVAESIATTASAGGASTRDARIPESGVYAGTGTQHSTAGDNPGVGLVITIGDRSTVEYTELSCVATLVPAGFSGRRRVYRERFTQGSCDEPGTWRVLKLSDSELDARWSAKGGDFTVTATLAR
jgi:tRNA A-37 threonylcarbamoyl transferase component Bud32